MEKATYQGITFRENYDSTFEVFKAEFGDTHVFKKFPPEQKLVELQKAFKIATANNTKEIKEAKASK